MTDLSQFETVEPKDIESQGSSLLYNSKVNDYLSCPRKAFFKHHLKIYPKERPRYFIVGSALHKAAEIALLEGEEAGAAALMPDVTGELQILKDQLAHHDLRDINALTEDERSMVTGLFEVFMREWNMTDREIIAVEQTYMMRLPANDFFTHWTIKADQVFKDYQGVWNGDIKTTSGYGPSTQAQYHNSLQTKVYAWITRMVHADLKGAKIFVCTKTKTPRCIEEPIPFDDNDYHHATLHLNEALSWIWKMENERHFPRNCASCINMFGKVCEYFPICMDSKAQNNPEYIQDLLQNWFEQRDPDEHLELDAAQEIS